MNTLKFIGMAILAIALNGTFTACSDDDGKFGWCSVSGFDIVVGDFSYALTPEGAILVQVNPELEGHVNIPEEVYYKKTTYSVIGIGFFERGVLYGSSVTSVTIPSSVTTINDGAFSNCTSLTSVTIPNSVTTIDNNAFSNCTSLTSVTIPSSVTTIGNYAFGNCTSLTSVTIPNSVTTIGESTFYNCTSLTSVTIPNSVTTIGKYAFSDCTNLTSVTIPSSVTEISDGAFLGCDALSPVHCRATAPPTIFDDTFSLWDVLYVPKGSLMAYKQSSWQKFSTIIEEN